MAGGIVERNAPSGSGHGRAAALMDSESQRSVQAFRRAFSGQAAGREDGLPPGDEAAPGLLCYPSAGSFTQRQTDEPAGSLAQAGDFRTEFAARSARDSAQPLETASRRCTRAV